MVAYALRTLPVLLRARANPRPDPVSRLSRRVWPSQIDALRHMNQAAYAQVMELGRVDWVFRTGAWGRWREDGVTGVVAEQRIVYRRELRAFASFVVDTRMVGVCGRLAQFEHHLVVPDPDGGERVHARGELSMLFVGPDGVLPPEAVPPLCAGRIAEPLRVEAWRVA